MRKQSAILVILVFFTIGANAFGAYRQRAVRQPSVPVLELDTPFKIGVDYGEQGGRFLLTGREDGTLWWVAFFPNALGHTWPEKVLDATRGPAEVRIRWRNSRLDGIRFYPRPERDCPIWAYPFDPLGDRIDLFIPGSERTDMLLDCPIWGVPNSATIVAKITAYKHEREYLVIEPRYWIVAGRAQTHSDPTDSTDGSRFVVMDHYADEVGQWYLPAAQALRDENGTIIVWNDARRVCGVIE